MFSKPALVPGLWVQNANIQWGPSWKRNLTKGWVTGIYEFLLSASFHTKSLAAKEWIGKREAGSIPPILIIFLRQSGVPNVVLEQVASASLENLAKAQILRCHPRLTGSETLEAQSINLYFKSPLVRFWWTICLSSLITKYSLEMWCGCVCVCVCVCGVYCVTHLIYLLLLKREMGKGRFFMMSSEQPYFQKSLSGLSLLTYSRRRRENELQQAQWF